VRPPFWGPSSGTKLGGHQAEALPCASPFRPLKCDAVSGPKTGPACGFPPAPLEGGRLGTMSSAPPGRPPSDAVSTRRAGQETWSADDLRLFEAEIITTNLRLQHRKLEPVPLEAIAALRALPLGAAMRCLDGVCANHVRSPHGLLRYKITEMMTKYNCEPLRLEDVTGPLASFQPQCGAPASSGAPKANEDPVDASRSAATSGNAGAAPLSASSGSVDRSQKRQRTEERPERIVWEAGDATPPRQHCPGCGVSVDVGTKAWFTRQGVYEVTWRRHSCGASWTFCNVPVGFGCGGQLSAWYKHDPLTNSEPGADRLGMSLPERPFPRVPHCIRCGNIFEAELLAPTGDVNKRAVALNCERCGISAFGSLMIQCEWLHVCIAARRFSLPVECPIERTGENLAGRASASSSNPVSSQPRIADTV
jgi:hypothetical protein